MAERELPLFPLNVVLFPEIQLPLHIFEPRYREMIADCLAGDRRFGVALISSGQEVGGPAETHPIGTIARIDQVERMPDGRMNLLTVGEQRFRLRERREGKPYAVARVEALVELDEPVEPELRTRMVGLFKRYLRDQGVPAERVAALTLPEDPASLSYLVASRLRVPATIRQQLLELDSAQRRLKQLADLLTWEAGGPEQGNARSFSLN
jgi:Lon protease-like protein